MLSVNANAGQQASGRDRGGPEAGSMSNAADHHGRPLRLTPPAQTDWDRLMSEFGECLAGAPASRYEFATAGLDRVRNQVLLAREHWFTRSVLESLDDRYTGGQ